MPTVTVQQAFDGALEHHQAGRLAEAEAIYRQILAAQPHHAETLHLLGVIAHQTGRHELAIESIRQAIAVNPDFPAAYSNLGEAYGAMGRLDEAMAAFRRALELQPDHSGAHNNLGIALAEQGQLEAALAAFHRTIELQPEYPRAHNNLGIVLARQERLDEADEAFRRALELKPDYMEAHNNLGIALAKRKRYDEAIAEYRQAIALKPSFDEVHYNLGLALKEKGKVDEALAAYRQAIALRPSYADAHNDLGIALKDMGEVEEALAAYRRAIALKPDFPDFHWNHALALLSIGRWKEGWEEYEWRVQRSHLARPDLTTPPWNGEDLSGRTLLIHQEGGFGDVIHFMRYLPMVRARGASRIIFEGGAPILPLMKNQPGIAETIERGQLLPAHDFHCPPQSFPRIFGTELHNVPAAIPYLTVDQEKQSAWRRKLSGSPDEIGERRPFLVGLTWAGSERPSDPRSRTLSTFGPLAQVPDVTFVSLQKGREAGQSAHVPPGMRFVDAAAEVEDFSELAALVSCLDAVASVDTSVAHLAGALGIPTWILLPTEPDFRWMRERDDSPWYPTVRLFRQQEAHSWDEPVQRMAAVLRAQAESAFP